MKVSRPPALAACAVAAAIGLAVPPGASAADDPCPNAALRSGPEAALPDCRAWEQVSPASKDGTDVTSRATVAAIGDGDRAYFSAAGGLPGGEAAMYDTGFRAQRTSGGWETKGIDAPMLPSSFITKASLSLSEDGQRALVVSQLALAPGAVQGGGNLYVRDLTQPASYRLVAASTDKTLFDDLAGFGGQGRLIGTTADMSTVAFASTAKLVDDPDVTGGFDVIYLWRNGELTVASRLPSGELGDQLGILANTPPRERGLLSEDGTRVTFTARGLVNGGNVPIQYQFHLGQGTTLLTRSHRTGDDPTAPVSASTDAFVRDDGKTVYFGNQGLTDDADERPEGFAAAVYRRTADGDLEDLTASITKPLPWRTSTIAVIGVGGDGRTVWLQTQTGLRPQDDSGASRIYALDTVRRTVSLAFTLGPNEPGGPGDFRISPNGRRVAIQSFSPVTGVDNADPACSDLDFPSSPGFCANIFTWNADAPDEPARCVSCGPAGTRRNAAASSFGRRTTSFDGRTSRAILDDGRVFFDTSTSLVPADTDTTLDVYEWAPGRGASLLSGTGSEPAYFGDVSPNGRDVLFVTAARLVAGDTDASSDAYTARVGGGIAAQRVAPADPGAGCSGDACRPSPAPTPDRPTPATPDFDPPAKAPAPKLELGGSPAGARKAFGATALRTAARRGRLLLPVRVNAPGTIKATLRGRVSGRRTTTVGRASATAKKAGTVRLTLRLSSAARRTLRRTGRLRLRLTVSYSAGLSEQTRTLTLTTKKGGAR